MALFKHTPEKDCLDRTRACEGLDPIVPYVGLALLAPCASKMAEPPLSE